MSYRRNAIGDDSITAHIKSEIAYAETTGRLVMVGLETTRLPETPNITFYGTSAAEFCEQKAILDQVMSNHPGYAGVMIHSYESYVDLIDKPYIVGSPDPITLSP
jgi:hypothetical protein